MKEKVTSYEISKRLYELGFDCESHSEWWGSTDIVTTFDDNGIPLDDVKLCDVRFGAWTLHYKAYDCWDLLMWLQGKNEFKLHADTGTIWTVESHFLKEPISFSFEEEVQNALGKAVIEILEANLIEESDGIVVTYYGSTIVVEFPEIVLGMDEEPGDE